MAGQGFAKAFKLEAVRSLEAGKQPAAAIARALGIKRELARVTEERDRKELDTPMMTLWRFRRGKAIEFHDHIDTAAVLEAPSA